MIGGILKKAPEDLQLLREGQIMDDKKQLSEYGLTSGNARAQMPAGLNLTFKTGEGTFENVDVTPYSVPPELPDVMRSQDTTGSGLGAGAEAFPMAARE